MKNSVCVKCSDCSVIFFLNATIHFQVFISFMFQVSSLEPRDIQENELPAATPPRATTPTVPEDGAVETDQVP